MTSIVSNNHENSGSPKGIKGLLRDAPFIQERVVPYFFGFAFIRAFNELMAGRFAQMDFLGLFSMEDFYAVIMVVTFLACIVLMPKITPLHSHKKVEQVAFSLSLLAGASELLQTMLFPDMWVLSLVCAVFSGLSGSLFILLWAEFHSCLEPFEIMFYISGAFMLGSVLVWLFADMTGFHRFFVLVICLAFSKYFLKKSFSKLGTTHLARGGFNACRIPWSLIIVLGIYEFVFGMREASWGFIEDTYLYGSIFSFAVVFLLVSCFARRFDFVLIYRTPFALMLCGLALVPIPALLSAPMSDMLVSSGYSLMFLLLTFLICDLSRRYSISVVLLCGIEELTAVFRLIGHQTSGVLYSGELMASLDENIVAALLTVCVVFASVVLLANERSSHSWGESFFGVGAIERSGFDHVWLKERCSELAWAYGLSPREHEVLELLAEKHTASYIENKLVIASGTLKSHTRRIYQKLGIHSKKELIALIGERSSRSDIEF